MAISGNGAGNEKITLPPQSEDIRRETEGGCGRKVASSRVPASLNVREEEQGGGLTDMRSAERADGSGVTVFQKV